MIHHTKPESAHVYGDAWAPLDDEWEVTALALVDADNSLDDGTPLFARLNYDEALAVAEREGADLLHDVHLDALRRAAVQLTPYLGTPIAENGIEHSRRHDADIWRQLRALGWDGKAPVIGDGKYWIAGAPAGRSRLGGWDKDGAGPGLAWWQPISVAHNRQHYDDGTTTKLVRRRNAAKRGPSWASRLTSPIAAAGRLLAGFLTGSAPAGVPVVARPSTAIVRPTMPLPADLPCVTRTVRAKGYRSGRSKAVRVVVLHTAECSEVATAAEAVAGYFAGLTDRAASAHFCVDNDSTIQTVALSDTAWAAPGANDDGVQIEMAGRAGQGADGWADAYSVAMLERTAELVAQLCARYGLPAAFVDEAGLLGGLSGITTHAAVSRAFKRSTHTDPGKDFPLAAFLDAVRARM